MDYKVESCVKKTVYSDVLEIASTGGLEQLKNSSVLITGALRRRCCCETTFTATISM